MKRLFALLAGLTLFCFVQAQVLGPVLMSPSASGGGSAPTFVQACNNSAFSGSAITCSNWNVGNPTSGHALAVALYWEPTSRTLSSVACSVGTCGTITLLDNPTLILNGNANSAQVYGTFTSTAATVLTASFSGAITTAYIVGWDISGQGASSQPDQHQISINGDSFGNYNTANAITSGAALTDSNTNDLAFGWGMFSTGISWTAGSSPLVYTLATNGEAGTELQTEYAAISGTSAQATISQSTANGGYAAGGIMTIHP